MAHNCETGCFSLFTLWQQQTTSADIWCLVFGFQSRACSNENNKIIKINIFQKWIYAIFFQGPGLVFEVYPEAIATLPGSQVWSCLFFVTMIMLGMDSAVSIFFFLLKPIISPICDYFGHFFGPFWHFYYQTCQVLFVLCHNDYSWERYFTIPRLSVIFFSILVEFLGCPALRAACSRDTSCCLSVFKTVFKYVINFPPHFSHYFYFVCVGICAY